MESKAFSETQALMKSMGLSLILADHTRFCNAIFDRGRIREIPPQTGDNLACPMCLGQAGFLVVDKDKRIWSCAEPHCISVNARKPPIIPAQQRPVCTLQQAGCPPSMCDVHISHITCKPSWIPTLREARNGQLQTLLLHGNPGSGKTHLACGLISDFIEAKRQTARFFSWDSIHRGWLDEYSGSSPANLSYQLSEIPLLVIDDLGSRDVSEKFLSWMQVVLGIRYDCKRPTIVTTNLTPDETRECVGDANWSRLKPTPLLISHSDRRLT